MKNAAAASISVVALVAGLAIGFYAGANAMAKLGGDTGDKLNQLLVDSAKSLSTPQGEEKSSDLIARGIVGNADILSSAVALEYCNMDPSQQSVARTTAERLEKLDRVAASSTPEGHQARLYIMNSSVGSNDKCVRFKLRPSQVAKI